MTPQLSRRGFVAGGVGFAALFAIGGVGSVAGSSGARIRPPGAQDEQRLLSLCLRCDRCRSACHANAIAVGHLEDGLFNLRLPEMSFSRGACDFCGGEYLCAVNCPTQAISFGFDPLSDKIGVAVVDRSECLLYRSSSHVCSKQCLAACSYGAISFDEDAGVLAVDADACNGCGACEHACPSASYAAYTASGHRGINVEPVEVVL